MEETINQVYKLEKEFLESKHHLQKFMEQEQQSLQKQTILKYSLEALNQDEQKDRKAYQPLGSCYILRPLENLKKDISYLHEKEIKSHDEYKKKREQHTEETVRLQKQLVEMSKELRVNQLKILIMIEFDPYGQSNTGTTLVAIKYNGGCILASDCLVTRGIVISDRGHKKIYEISPSAEKFGSIKVLGCGNSAHIQMVTRLVFNQLNFHAMELDDQQEIKLATVVKIFSSICYSNKNFISAAFIISNGREIYSISSGGMWVKNELYTSRGSGSTFISGYLKDKIKEGMNFYETREVAVKAIALAIVHDGSSGGNLRIVDLKDNGKHLEEILQNKEIRRILID